MSVSVNGTNGLTFSDGSSQATAWVPGMRNRIINGDFRIDQRNAGASVTTATNGAYNLDRWNNNNNSGASRFTVQQTPTATETGYATRVSAGFTNYMACTSSGSYSITSGDVILIRQYIEGYNVADLAWGTSGAKAVTLSFWVYSSLTGTFGGAVHNGGSTRSYPFSYTISASNTWEQKTVTIAGDTSGTWLTTNGVGLVLNFGLGVGSTYSGTAGAWASADYRSATGATSVVGTSGATFYITGVQLEKGSTATSFDYRPYGTELALCQRYAYVSSTEYFGATQSNQSVAGPMYFPQTMRTAPSISGTFTVNTGSAGTLASARITERAAQIYNSAANWTVGAQVQLTTTISAEL